MAGSIATASLFLLWIILKMVNFVVYVVGEQLLLLPYINMAVSIIHAFIFLLLKSLMGCLLQGLLCLGRNVMVFSWQNIAVKCLPHLKSLVGYTVKNGLRVAILSLTKAAVIFIRVVLPQVMKSVVFAVEITREHAYPFVCRAASTFLKVALPHFKKSVVFVVYCIKEYAVPWMIKTGQYSVEFVKQHPWQCGISVLLLLQLYYIPGLLRMLLKMMIKVAVKIQQVLIIIVRGSEKLMQEPGRGGFIIAGAVIESNPSGYYRALRASNCGCMN